MTNKRGPKPGSRTEKNLVPMSILKLLGLGLDVNQPIEVSRKNLVETLAVKETSRELAIAGR